MSLTSENGTDVVMPVSPMYNGFGGNGFGGDGWWIILLFILLAGNNGWGNGFGNGNNDLYPWINQAGITTEGFQNQALNGQLNGIQNEVQNLSTQLCNGFAGVEQGANARQIADMNQMFAMQTAMTGGLTDLSSQFANCCCENRLGLSDLKYTVATENCADRQALNESVRDILANQTANVQRILDQMCQDKIDAKNDEIAQLRQEILYARGQASQIAQNQQVIDGIYNRLDTCPVGTTPVYGRTPIFSCNNSGCGCNGNF